MVKCVTYNCNSIRNNSENVRSLFNTADIILLQEIMLSRSDLPLLNDFNDDFDNIAFVKDRESLCINEGRPTGGVAIFWRRNLSPYISPVIIDDTCIGIVIDNGFNKVLIFNVYMPCDMQTLDSLDRYRSALAKLEVVIREQNVSDVIVAGDFNADPFKGRFWKELKSLQSSLSLVFIDEKLGSDSFTYLSPGQNTTSWLDHILCSFSMAPHLSNVFIDYYSAICDHFCMYFDINLFVNVEDPIVYSDNLIEKMVRWDKLTKEDKLLIRSKMDDIILSNGLLCNDIFYCKKLGCQDPSHRSAIDEVFESVIDILLISTNDFAIKKNNKYKIVPGWNKYVKDLYADAHKYFLEWKCKGKPVEGPVLDNMKTSRSLFKTALQNCKKNEDKIRRENLLSKLKNKRHKDFWNDVYKIKSHSTRLKAIDGCKDPKSTCKIFSDKYKQILAVSKYDKVACDVLMSNNFSNHSSFTMHNIRDAILRLKCSIGIDGIHSNHLKFCSDLFVELITELYNSFTIHHYVPMNLIKGEITPTVKDVLGDLSSSSNYRPVMASSVLLKLFEYCLLEKISPYIELNDRQHGFRESYSTMTACLTLKETILNYSNCNSDVYACFVDISKAFDMVSHEILMNKLLACGVPDIYVKLIYYWYSNQKVRVKYGSYVSDEWFISNGVRQGGVLSGLFFNIYINGLIDEVVKSNFGCKLGIHDSSIIVYADDLVLLSPSAKGLQILIDIAAFQANKVRLNFNKDKSKWMVFRSPKSKISEVTPMTINGDPIERVYNFKYLGIIVRDDICNSDDIQRALSKFYSDFNMILRNFSFADFNVKLFLFRHYCLQFYGSELWFNHFKTSVILKQFAIAYHKAIKKILGLSTHESNHYACQQATLFTFRHLLNKIVIMAAVRLFNNSPCVFFSKIMYFLNVSSFFLNEIKNLICEDYGIDTLFDNDMDAVLSRIVYVQNHEETMR